MDLDSIAELNADPEVMKYILPPLSRDIVAQVIQWFQNEWTRLGYGCFALFEKESGKFVGQCGLQKLEGKPESKEVEIAFIIAKSFWGKGYATEAVAAVLDFGFTNRGLSRIVAVTMEENSPSNKVLEKIGFQYQGNKRVYNRMVMYYSLDHEEFRPSQPINQH